MGEIDDTPLLAPRPQEAVKGGMGIPTPRRPPRRVTAAPGPVMQVMRLRPPVGAVEEALGAPRLLPFEVAPSTRLRRFSPEAVGAVGSP